MAKRPGDITPSTGPGTGLSSADTEIEKFRDDTVSTETTGMRDMDLAADDDASAETEQIKARIEETRAELGETIDRIQEKLSFSNISEQVSDQVNNAIETAKDSVYEATIGKVAHFMKNTGKELSRSSLVTTAKENPLPLILIGVGAGLLAYQGFGRSSNTRRNVSYGRTPRLMGNQYDRDRSTSMVETAGSGLRSVTEGVSGAAGSVKDTVSSAAGTVKSSVSGAAETAYDGVSRAASSTYSGVTNLAHRATETASDLGHKAQETYEHYLEEKPWAIGAVALVAGAAIGMAIPSTRYEGKLMGEARMNLMNRVSDTASEFVDKAKQAATEVGQNVSQTVSEGAKNLTDETLG